MKLIDRFTSLLPQRQAEQIQKELQSGVQSLMFTDIADLKAQIQEELRLLLESDSALRFTYENITSGTKRSSKHMNLLLERLAGDLASLFAEADNTARLATLQQTVYKKEIISKLENSVRLLEREVAKLEVKATTSLLAKGIGYEDFRMLTQPSPSLSEVGAQDPKRLIDEASKINSSRSYGLQLPLVGDTAWFRLSGIRELKEGDILPSSSPFSVSEVPASTPGEAEYRGGTESLLDGLTGTFWTKTLLKDTESTASLSLLIDIGGRKKINTIEIETEAGTGMRLTRLFTQDDSLVFTEVEIPTVEFKRSVQRITIPESYISQVALVFTQDESYTLRGKSAFRFGLDNIKIGLSEFARDGYYICESVKTDLATKLTLQSEFTTTENSAVEFWVKLDEKDVAGNIVYSKIFPMLALEEEGFIEYVPPSARRLLKTSFKIDEFIEDDSVDLAISTSTQELERPADYLVSALSRSNDTTTIVASTALNETLYRLDYIPLYKQLDLISEPLTDSTNRLTYMEDNTVCIAHVEASSTATTTITPMIFIRRIGDRNESATVYDLKLIVE